MSTENKMRNEIYKELKVSFQATEESIKERKEYRKQLKFKVDLYNQCLDDHLLEKGSQLIKEHLAAAKAEIKEVEAEIDKLNLEKDAYRIELEVFETAFRE